jgi:hypothetical protein
MSRNSTTQAADQEQVQAQVTLERLLGRARGHAARVVGLRRELNPFVSVFPAEVLFVALEGGEEVRLFVKHLGPEQADHPEKQCREREQRVYEELLREERLPVSRYYGACWNRATQRRELYLEFIDDWNLKYQELEHWFTAARRLAHLHAYFARRAATLLASDFLLRLDPPQLTSWALRALAVVADQSPDLAGELVPVVDGYDRVCWIVCAQPLTLVHNDMAPKNVLVDRSSDPARICLVDWEMAGVGCGVMDLVDLKYGLDPGDDRRMSAVYCAELAETGLLPSTQEELAGLFAACELHRSIYRLAFSKAWKIPLERTAHWVAEIKALARRL